MNKSVPDRGGVECHFSIFFLATLGVAFNNRRVGFGDMEVKGVSNLPQTARQPYACPPHRHTWESNNTSLSGVVLHG